MEDATENSVRAPGGDGLPASTRLVEVAGKTVYLVGTAHVSRQSVEDVRKTIEQVRPDTVCVELCQSRYANITNREQWRKTNVVRIIRDGKAMLLLTSLIMTSFQRRIGKELGVMPGAEMVEAIEQAKKHDLRLALVDREVQVTLKRTWGRLGFGSKFKMVFQLVASLFVVERVDPKMIEEIKQGEKLTDMLDMLAHEFPLVKGTLIDERDVFLAQKIRDTEGNKIVAVVGAGHVPGILEEIQKETSLEPYLAIPKPSLWPQLMKWGIPALIVSLLVYGFYTAGVEHSIGSIYIWVLVNGVLSALGAALALGHPITVASAFFAAPLTSLNPMIAAGWVAGLVQAFIKKPTVEDLENLPEAITSVRGFWQNSVSRILLVVALSNLGSSLGTFISTGWIAARLV